MTSRVGASQIFRLVILSLVSLAVSGCMTWVSKPGFDESEYRRDRFRCEQATGARDFRQPWEHCMEALGYGVSNFGPTAAARAAVPPPTPPPPTRTPFGLLTEQRRELTRALLKKIDAGDCLRLLSCLEDYEGGVRELARRVGYSFVSGDELLFRAAREIARAADDGTITQKQAINRLLALDAQIDEIYRALQIERARRP